MAALSKGREIVILQYIPSSFNCRIATNGTDHPEGGKEEEPGRPGCRPAVQHDPLVFNTWQKGPVELQRRVLYKLLPWALLLFASVQNLLSDSKSCLIAFPSFPRCASGKLMGLG